MSAPDHPTSRRRPVPLRRAVTLVVVAATATLLTGCGLRLETPPPVEPSPDAVEHVRGRTVDDALGLAQDARTLLDAAPAEPVAAVLADVAAFGELHAEQLGGVYDSGLPEPTPSASPSSTTASPAPTAESVLAELAEDAATALADADAVPDGPLARLVGSVATARTDLAGRLATALGLPAPEIALRAGVDGTPEGGADQPPTPSATPTPGSAADEAPAPAGLDRADLDALTLAHDEAGYALEVVAAKLEGDPRTLARQTAAGHRDAAERWATSAGTAGQLDDPRRVAYALPAGLDDPTVAAGVARGAESAVADTYATLVASADAGARAELLTGLADATRQARAWGATPVAFPGMPELAAEPLPTPTAG
ncbi:DUF4439 domain-containing protein [Cellulomonas algicola]|uniref:DUF4439 domain-containing protein n=1 Tax=Cellulomonas algicola TaxID=2071633 RepID=A0A401UZB8_9CELL|nr:DUF4439 domain-containing protein [Cellulomonas algicola]GCD20039.1 hypothetical protein CTKZ_16010 [Cellulomonas algicola]